MKKCIPAFLLAMSFAHATPPDVIYGEDNRVDTMFSPSPLYKKLAQSSAAMVLNENIVFKSNVAELHGETLGESESLCEKERFYSQPSVAWCSGFLVGKDLVVTAGHCMESITDCAKAKWVFNFKADHEAQTAFSVSKDDVFSCKKIVKQSLSRLSGTDFAIIQLDRPVTNSEPVKLAREDFAVGTPLVMIGHPSGLPQKIADGAKVISKNGVNFRANLDAFHVNSGSGVFNSQTGDLVGILVNGADDYRTNKDLGCKEVDVLPDESKGEGVSSFVQFAKYL